MTGALYYLFYFLSFLWMFPPFRQRNGEFFRFFLIISLSQITHFIMIFIFRSTMNYGYLFFCFLMVPALRPGILRKKLNVGILVFIEVAALGVAMMTRNPYVSLYMIVAGHIAADLILFSNFIINLTVKRVFPVFLLIVFISEVLSVLKALNALLGTPLGVSFFIMANYADFLFVLFFIFVASDKKWLYIPMRRRLPLTKERDV